MKEKTPDNDKEEAKSNNPESPGKSEDTKIAKENEFQSPNDSIYDKTIPIPKELIGSHPQRLLEPALQVLQDGIWERYPLKETEINIGNIRNRENDLSLNDSRVSRNHAKIIFDKLTKSWFFVDMGSTNGSTFNDNKVSPNEPVKITTNDIIVVGATQMKVYIP